MYNFTIFTCSYATSVHSWYMKAASNSAAALDLRTPGQLSYLAASADSWASVVGRVSLLSAADHASRRVAAPTQSSDKRCRVETSLTPSRRPADPSRRWRHAAGACASARRSQIQFPAADYNEVTTRRRRLNELFFAAAGCKNKH